MLKTNFKKTRVEVFCFYVGVFLLLLSCSKSVKNNELILLRLSPEIGSQYEISTNMNIALDMKQPININMEFFIQTKYDSIFPNGDFLISSKISRVKAIMSSGIFHRSYDTEHPVVEGDLEKELHNRLSKVVNVRYTGIINSLGEVNGTSNIDSIFKGDKELKKQFEEIEKSFSNGGVVFPVQSVKKGSVWSIKIDNMDTQNMTQVINYKVKKIAKEEIVVDISGVISYGSDDVKGGGKIKGLMKINRRTGINKFSRIIQDYKMDINGYKARGINTVEVKSEKM